MRSRLSFGPHSIVLERVLSRYSDTNYSDPETISNIYIQESSFRDPGNDVQTLDAKGMIILPFMTWPDPQDNTRKVTIRTRDRIELPEPFEPRFPTLVGVRIVSDRHGPHHLEITYR